MFDEYPDLLTQRQTQELLHIGKNKIPDYIHSGRLRALVLDEQYLSRKEDVIHFVSQLPYA